MQPVRQIQKNISIWANYLVLPDAERKIRRTTTDIQNDPDPTRSSFPTQPPIRFVHPITRAGKTNTDRTPSTIRKLETKSSSWQLMKQTIPRVKAKYKQLQYIVDFNYLHVGTYMYTYT